MIAVLIASVLAVSAIQDTTSALPGTSLRFGAESSRFGAAQGFQSTPRPQPPDRQEREGAMRFFGIDATATLRFLDRRLVEAEFVIESASPHQISYIGDDLARRGYRRGCRVLEQRNSDCTWTGATSATITRDGARIRALIRPLTRDAEPPGLATAAAMPMHPDTLVLQPGWNQEDFLIEPAEPARYPLAARDAGVQGIVRTLATVDTTGTVIDVQIMRGIAELDSAAVATVSGMRFRPFRHENRLVGGWVRISLQYTIH